MTFLGIAIKQQTLYVDPPPHDFPISQPLVQSNLQPFCTGFRLDFCRFDFCVNCLRLIAVLNLLKDIPDKGRAEKWGSKRVSE